MGTGWHVPEQGGPPGLEPGFYAEDQAALDALLADPTTEHALVAPGAPSPLVHGLRARVATPDQAEVLRAHESRRSARIAKLRALSDHDAIDEVIRRTVEYPEHWDSTEVLSELRDAGFIRRADLAQAVERVHETIEEINGAEAKGVLSQSVPGIRHWLHRVLDFLTGEDHSGCTSLPAPKRRA